MNVGFNHSYVLNGNQHTQEREYLSPHRGPPYTPSESQPCSSLRDIHSSDHYGNHIQLRRKPSLVHWFLKRCIDGIIQCLLFCMWPLLVKIVFARFTRWL